MFYIFYLIKNVLYLSRYFYVCKLIVYVILKKFFREVEMNMYWNIIGELKWELKWNINISRLVIRFWIGGCRKSCVVKGLD